MFDFKRIRIILIAGLFVAAPLWLIHFGLTKLWPTGRAAAYQSTITPGAPENVLRKISDDMEFTQGKLAPEGCKLGVVIGASTGFMATNTYVLQQEAGLPVAWYGYFQTGGNGSDENRLVKLLRRYQVKPDYLILMLNPFMMSDSTQSAEKSYFPNVLNFNRQSRNFLLRTKTNFLALFGQDRADVACSTNVNPEREFFRANFGMAVNNMTGEDYAISVFQKLGFFDKATYPINGINYRALAELVCRERRRGTKVVAVILPESSKFRGMFPPEAKQSLMSALESCRGADRPLILDFSTFLEDSVFMDSYHISPQSTGPFRLCTEIGHRIRSAELSLAPPEMTTRTTIDPPQSPRR